MAVEPVVICGSVRSGTTMFRLMLGQHSRLFNVGEMEYMVEYLEDGAGEDGAPWPDMEAYRDWLKLDRMFLGTGMPLPQQADYRQAVQAMTAFHAGRTEKPRLCLTIHSRFHRAPDFWPDAKYIYVLRDPRDVSLSCEKMGWAGNTYYGARHWTWAFDRLQKLKSRVKPENLFIVKYEDLVLDPATTLRTVLTFLGETYEQGLLEYDHASTYSKPDKRLVNQWQRKQSKRQIKLTELRVGPRLEAAGYERSGLSLSFPAFLRLIAFLEHRVVRMYRSWKRYGFGLWLRVKLTRVLGLKRQYVKARMEVNAVETSLLK